MDRFLILTKDLFFSNTSRDLRSRKYDSVSNISEYLKGTLLQECVVRSPASHLTCIVLDTNEMIHVDVNAIEELNESVMLLLLAISNCKDRYEVFRNKERLADGLEMQPGCSVVVRHPSSGELHGKLRYKGEIINRLGIHFGVELINGRGKGFTNGTISGKIRYFDCPEDSGMFLALNRVMSKKYDQSRHHGSTLRQNAPFNSAATLSKYSFSSAASDPPSVQTTASDSLIGVTLEELEQLGIFIGMDVYIFTEVRGKESQERGTVRFIGRLPNELPSADIYVGIDLVNPVGNGRGVFNKRQLFKTKPNHAALVPLSGVLPADTCDTTPLITNNIEDTTKEPIGGYSPFHYATEPRRRPTDDSGRYSDNSYARDYGLNDDFRFQSSLSNTMSRQHSHRQPPDGGPIIDFEEDLPSQVDIYGVDRNPSSEIDKKMPFTHHTFPMASAKKKLTRKNSPKSAGASQYFNEAAVLEVDSMVEVIDGIDHIGDMGIVGGPVRGVIKWIGPLPGEKELMAGVELELPYPGLTDGSANGHQYFKCMPERALFTCLKNCRMDPRFAFRADEAASELSPKIPLHNFGGFEASRIEGKIPPAAKLKEDMVGKGKGIQGHHNSCYLDSSLFSMFAYSYCLDSILYRPKNQSDLPQYDDVQQVLLQDIVNPLRKRNFVRADKIMKLRKLLDELGSVTGLTNEEKDPEEFLQTLLNHVFKAEPLFELRQGDSDHIQECYFYQIFFDKDEKMVLPSTQLLMEQSFLASDLKFREVPSCLILQMPRFGKDYKMYNRVRPSLTLDVTDMVEKLPRSCTVCGGLAEYECKQCSIERSMQEHITSYCEQCAKISHQHPSRRQHEYKRIEICDEYRSFTQQDDEVNIERHVLELYAVVCIETSHYVSFAKCGYGRSAKWCFFDSMADRVGEQSGYNIPEVTRCDQFEEWLQMDQSKILEMDRKEMTDHMRRLFCDAYLCLYQSREMMCF